MIKTFHILLFLSICQIGVGQELQSIVVQVIHADEPPTKHGPQIFEINFTVDEKNIFVAKSYAYKYKRKKREKLQNPIIIEADDARKFLSWKSKSDFLLDEFGIDVDELHTANSAFKPDFPIVQEAIRMDSFKTCADWQFKRSLSTGGYSIRVELKEDNKTTEFLNYNTDDIGAYKFDLKSFLAIQPLLQNKIPNEFGIRGFFEKQSLIDILNYYYKVIECEGYYYREFIKQNPQRTKQENRMMTGWNFKEYLKNK